MPWRIPLRLVTLRQVERRKPFRPWLDDRGFLAVVRPPDSRQMIQTAALPSLTLGAAQAALVARITRSALLEELGGPLGFGVHGHELVGADGQGHLLLLDTRGSLTIPHSIASISEKSLTVHGNSVPSAYPEPLRKNGVADRSKTRATPRRRAPAQSRSR